MRKHSVRKWIHAICDLLPLLVIPIFALAVRSDNNFTPIEVQQEKVEVVNFNQLITFNDFEYSYNGLDYSSSGGIVTVNGTSTARSNVQLYPNRKAVIDSTHKLLIKGVVGSSSTQYISFVYYNQGAYLTYNTYFSDYIFSMPTGAEEYQLEVVGAQVADLTLNNFKFAPQLFDLTLMFGVGNEPTITQFNTWYTDFFYPFNSGTNELLKTGTYDTYNDTDVGSQMVYTLYNTCDKYFNFNQVGLFQNVYDWFQLNIMNGTAPMSFYIVWNVILFEFIMDLIFLTYMVFMFIIDFTECMIDRFFEKSYRGGR